MGRNKGRQCGGYTSKMERFSLQRLMQRQVSKVATQRRQERQAQWKLDQRRRAEANDTNSAVKRRVRVDVVKALMNARLKDDQVEQIKLKRIEAITTELQRSTTIQSFATLQERCLHEIAKTFDLYSSTCPYTREFFVSFEPWMITRLSELTTAFKTMNDDNVLLLLQQTIDDLTIGFIRQEQALALLVEDTEGKQQLTWQRSGNLFLGGHHEVESWDELDVEEVDLVQTQDDIHLRSLKLVSCRGLSVDFLARLTQIHPYIEHLEITDCFDADDGEEGTAIMRQLVQWRSLKTLRLSWCSWLTTECLVAFAYQLLEPPASGLEELHVSHYFDVVEDYVRSIYEDLLPNLQVTL